MKRAAIYCRVSTSIQAQEGDSIPAQLSALRTYIDNRSDMVCAGEYIDDGVSGTIDARDELQKLLCDVRAGKVDIILVTKLDRLYRSIRHYLNMMDTLDKYGVGWVAIWEPIYDTTTPQGRLIVNQMMSIAQFEAENTGQRVRQVFAYKIQKGEVTTGAHPIGFDIVGKRLVPNSDAGMVLDLFRHYNLHNNLNELVRYAFSEYGLVRTDVALKGMLRNTLYVGRKRDNDHFCAPIVPLELWESVQRKLRTNIKCSRKHDYIFSGMVYCKECGRSYSAIWTKGYARYRCQKHFRPAGACINSVTLAESVIERYLLENVEELLEERELEYKHMQKRQKNEKQKVSALLRKRERLKELFLNEMITLDEYKADREKLDAEIEACGTVTEAPPLAPIELPKRFEELYETFSVQEKRYMWQAVIKEIWIGRDREIEVVFL